MGECPVVLLLRPPPALAGPPQPNLNSIANQRITLGWVPDGSLYCPDEDVTRAQMVALLHRALG